MKHIISSVRIMIFFTALLGLIYPLMMTGVAQVLFKEKADGSLVSRNGQVIGSELISQNFERPGYFLSRPSAVSHNPLPSGGSNLGPTSESLKNIANERRVKLKENNPNQGEPPQDLVFTSASGLDPHLSLDAVIYQVERIAKERMLDKDVILKIVQENVEGRQFGIFGEKTVNVLALNIALDSLQNTTTTQEHTANSVK